MSKKVFRIGIKEVLDILSGDLGLSRVLYDKLLVLLGF